MYRNTRLLQAVDQATKRRYREKSEIVLHHNDLDLARNDIGEHIVEHFIMMHVPVPCDVGSIMGGALVGAVGIDREPVCRNGGTQESGVRRNATSLVPATDPADPGFAAQHGLCRELLDCLFGTLGHAIPGEIALDARACSTGALGACIRCQVTHFAQQLRQMIDIGIGPD